MKLSSVGATCSIAMHPACGIVFYVKIFMCLQFYILHSALYIFNCGLPRCEIDYDEKYLFEWVEWTDRSYGAIIFSLLFFLQTVISYGANKIWEYAVVQNIIHFLKNEMFVEKMEINKAKPHRGELFVEMI